MLDNTPGSLDGPPIGPSLLDRAAQLTGKIVAVTLSTLIAAIVVGALVYATLWLWTNLPGVS